MYRKGGLNEGIFKQFMRARHKQLPSPFSWTKTDKDSDT